MAPLRVGLMGLGRIGRNLFRILHASDDVELAAVSDIADHAALEYLLRFDTLLGRFPDALAVREGYLYVGGRRIPMLSTELPGDVPWSDLGVDVVVEATGRRRPRAQLEAAVAAGAGRVLLCAPSQDPPDLTVVMGVNDDRLRREHRIISNASCTAHCAAPVMKILDDAFGIARAFLTTVHAYTNQQRLADVPAEDLRRGRAAAQNIIPQETNAAAVVMELLPQLAGRVSGLAVNVPVPDGSVVDLVAWYERATSIEAINEVMRTAAGSARWRRYLAYEENPIVSSDILKTPYSSTFDAQATQVLGDRVAKTLAWYDNGWGYANRVVDLARRLHDLDRGERQKEVA